MIFSKTNFIKDKVRDYEQVMGIKEITKPNCIVFRNSLSGIKMLNKHIVNEDSIFIHADVDMDGLGSCYVMTKFLQEVQKNKLTTTINGGKSHGITKEIVDKVNQEKCDLFIVVDAGSNDLDLIKSCNCDVLVLDHHEITHNETKGQTQNGSYVIVNNTIDNIDAEELNKINDFLEEQDEKRVDLYKADQDMCGCLVVYEFLRMFEKIRKMPKSILEKNRLYQWVAVTLFTDVINTGNNRNLYYLSKTLKVSDIETTLYYLKTSLDTAFSSKTLDKGYIGFTLAPVFNSAMRFNKNEEALNCIIYNPNNVIELKKYSKMQKEIVDKIISKGFVERENYCYVEIDNWEEKSFSGLVATRIASERNKNTIVFVKDSKGNISGSFRGRKKGVDYREAFIEYDKKVWAMGHKEAFGFGAPITMVKDIMESLIEKENGYVSKPYLTIGVIDEKDRGIYHTDNARQFISEYSGIIASANSLLSTNESINITVESELLELKSKTPGGLIIYDYLGIECRTFFEEIKTKYATLYLEENEKGLSATISEERSL